MRFIPRCFGFLLVVILCAGGTPANAQQNFVYRITLDDDIITPVAVEYIETSIKKAEADGAAALLIELDTPGGLLSSTRRIVKDIMNATVPVIVYVAPSGARAGSAGVFITLAAHVAAMAPSTNIGAAHPVSLEDKRTTSDVWRDLVREVIKEKRKTEDAKTQGSEEAEKSEKEAAEPMDQKI